MKRSLIAVFSISVTAGTIYFGYDQLKQVLIKRLLKQLDSLAAKTDKKLNRNQLQVELDKLYLWDLRLMDKLLQAISRGNKPEATALRDRVTEKQLLKKADLKSIEEYMLNI